jgi:hypothetical protein
MNRKATGRYRDETDDADTEVVECTSRGIVGKFY